MVLFTSGIAMLVSIMAQRPRDAILVTYCLQAAWLVFPAFLTGWQKSLDEGSLWWVGPVNNYLVLVNPAVVWEHATRQVWVGRGAMRPTFFVSEFTGAFYWMVGLQSALGLLLIGLAVFGLRPLRGSSWPGAQPQTGWWTRLVTRSRAALNARAAASFTRNRLLTTPRDRAPCGDDPMLWKERHASLSMGGGLRWLGSRPMVLFFGVLVGCYVADVAYPVIASVFTGKVRGWADTEISAWLRSASVALAVLGMLGVAASAAVSMTGVREQDTWISLATTLLTPAEVIRAKQFGAVWSARRVGVALLVIWALGLVLGAIHPLGVLAAATYAAFIAWLIAAMGVFASSFARTSTRALVATFITLLIASAITQWPTILRFLLFNYHDLPGPRSQSPLSRNSLSAAFSLVISLVPFLAPQVLVGAAMTFGARRRLRATWGQ